MADDDKLINVIVKYAQTGAEQVAKTSEELTAKELKAWKEANKEAVDLAGIRAKAWEAGQEKIRKASEATVKSDEDALKKMRENFNNLTEDQLRAWDKLKPANGVIGDPSTPTPSSGSPLDPEIPKRYNAELTQTQMKFQQLKQSAAEFGQVAGTLTVVGGVLTGGLVASANNYVQTMGTITKASAEWLGYQEDIKDANLEIGKEATTALLPAYKAAAEFMKNIAAVVGANPWIVQAALYAGGAATAIGAAGAVISQIAKVMADMGLLLAKMEASKAANLVPNPQGGFGGLEYGPGGPAGGSSMSSLGTVTLMATSVIIGAEIGAAIGNWLGQIIYGEAYEKQGLDDAFVTLAKIVQLPWKMLEAEIAKLPPSLAKAGIAFVELMATILTAGTYNGAKYVTEKSAEIDEQAAANEAEQITMQEVQAFEGFQKQMASIEENYDAQRLAIITQYEQQAVAATEQYEAQRDQIIKNYEAQVAQVTENYAKQRAQAVENYEAQVAQVTEAHRQSSERAQAAFELASKRAAEAHAKEMQRMAEDHNSRILDLAGQRDALGIVKENQAYEKQRSRAEEAYQTQQQQRQEDFEIQQQQREEDFQRQLEEMKANFEKQDAQAKEAHAAQLAQLAAQEKERLAQLDEQHKVQMKKLEEQEEERLAKLKEAYDKQIEQIQTAFVDRLRALDATILGDTAAFEAHMQQQAIEFQAWLNNFKASQSSTSTGTTPPGTVNGADPSSIVSASQAKSNSMIPSFTGQRASSGARSLHVTVQSRSLSIAEIKDQINSSLDMKLSELLPAFGA